MERQSGAVPGDIESRTGFSRAHDGVVAPRTPASAGELAQTDGSLSIAIAATFTADSLKRPLEFWMETLAIPASVELAPYAQVMQELLNPHSSLSRNAHGFNILLIRLEDWIRDRLQLESTERNLEHLRQVAGSLGSAVSVIRRRTRAPLFIYFCPSSSSLRAEYGRAIKEIQSQLMRQLGGVPDVLCWTHADLSRLYPVSSHEDSTADRIGHIPYSNDYFVALATFLARRVTALVKPPYKVIAVDCDNTLWNGICGEDGPAGVELTPAHLEFQKLLVRQHDAGMLLCLCSKNNASDVEAVLRNRPDMPLREEHLISSCVNWNAKSTNLEHLSRELGLSLDSFIFVDDNPLECAEVRARCPSVLTLRFPESEAEAVHFMNQVWAFDRSGVTEEAQRRTAQYKENRVRSVALEQATNLEGFLASLELQVDVSPMQSGQLPRVAELIQRTNQFNLTTIRRRAAEIEEFWSEADTRILVVHVRDRFGDYGLVGAVFCRNDSLALDVDTFVLSCRVLGRGTEHRIVRELGRIARRDGLTCITLRYRETPRNAPAWQFLESSFEEFRVPVEGVSESLTQSLFRIPVEYAEGLRDRSGGALAIEETSRPAGATNDPRMVASTAWHEAAFRLSRIPDIAREIALSSSSKRQGSGVYVAPRTPLEAAVAGIWAEVLGHDQVGVRDDFFELGGDSLLAVQAIARIGFVLGLELSLHEVFEGPTVEAVAAKLAGASQAGPPIEPDTRTGPVPLSWAQQRLWFIDQLEGASAAYHLAEAIRLRGELDRVALQAALDALIARHESLRTVFVKTDEDPVQRIVPEARFALRLIDLTDRGAAQREADMLEDAREEVAKPFDLSAGPLIRGTLLQLAQDEHVLLVTMHHIVSDGWSIGVLIRELGALYGAFRLGRPDPLPRLPIQYVDYAQWQRRWLAGAELQEQLTYWTQHLRGAPELLELPTDRPRPATKSYRGASVDVSLGADLTADVKALARRFNLTLAMTLYAAWSIVLARLSGQRDIVVGMPVANRRRTELEGLIGFFVNTLAIRVQLDDDPAVSDLLQRIKSSMLGAYTHQDVPFEKVVEALRPARSLSHSPVFQVMFVLQNTPRGAMELPGLTLTDQPVPVCAAQFDLGLSLQESADGISGTLNYSSDLFDRATVERWVEYFGTILSGMVRAPQLKISRLPLMSAPERQQIIESFGATQTACPREKLVHQLFEEQVRRTPDAIAVICEEQSLTYAELNCRANQLAHYLRHKGVGPDRLVALCVERSVEMLVGILGVLKAGGAYVPLDPTNPRERLEHVLADARPSLLLMQERLRSVLPPTLEEVIALDGDWSEIATHDAGNPDPDSFELKPEHLAYVIYTSGSTGRPKGVMIEHRSIVNYAVHAARQFDVASGDGSLICTSVSFDLMLTGLYPTLLCGRAVRLCPEENGIPDLSREVLRASNLAPLKLTPSHLTLLEPALKSGQLVGRVRVLVLGGEPLHASAVQMWRAYSPGTRIFNHYGPTETTVGCIVNEVGEETSGAVPIGRPISNVRVYILDQHMQPVPIGVRGEIYIGGAGVARGYLNRPELTAERFSCDPFGSDRQARMYRTGDMGRWRVDGTIEYLGRNDHQVKIRGFRIELGEIEAQLVRHPQVKEAAVTVREDVPDERRLVAYVILDDPSSAGPAPSAEALLAHLKARLPDYMMPSAFVVLEQLPLTSNGKLDRRALPTPEFGAFVRRQFEVPQGDVEEALARIWQELLRVEGIGRHDDFFELGGHSLLAMRVVSRMRELLNVELSVRAIFDAPTVEQLSARVKAERTTQAARESHWMGSFVRDLRRDIDEMQDEAVFRRIAELEKELRGIQ